MVLKNKYSLIVVLFLGWSLSGHCLTSFPKGTCNLQGFLEISPSDQKWLLSVNHKSNSETKFKLETNRFIPDIKYLNTYVELNILLLKDTFSAEGTGVILNLVKLLNPYREIKRYRTTDEVKAACTKK